MCDYLDFAVVESLIMSVVKNGFDSYGLSKTTPFSVTHDLKWVLMQFSSLIIKKKQKTNKKTPNLVWCWKQKKKKVFLSVLLLQPNKNATLRLTFHSAAAAARWIMILNKDAIGVSDIYSWMRDLLDVGCSLVADQLIIWIQLC